MTVRKILSTGDLYFIDKEDCHIFSVRTAFILCRQYNHTCNEW